ncbi:MAG: DUF169 domain-containing protein [Terracidiphilus sp.]
MLSQESYARLAADLTASLTFAQPPIAISFSNTVPKGVGAPYTRVAAGCRFWQDASHATFATSSEDHSTCAIGVYTHNLESSPAQQTDLVDALKVFGDLGYVRTDDLPLIPVLASRSKYVVYAPLSESPLPPDVVLLFANSNQTLVLSEAAQQVEGGTPPAMGRPACAVIPQVANTGRAALSLGCCGARAYLDVLTDDVALFAIPGAKVEAYVERIVALAKANSVLTRFHGLRRKEIVAGGNPTVRQSLETFMAS